MGARVFHRLYFHVIWTTYAREPMIVDEVRPWLIQRVVLEAQAHKAMVLACNAMPDHVHLLVNLPPSDLTKFVGQVKGATGFQFNREFSPKHTLKWQDGYGIVTMRVTDTPDVIRYVENQQLIHAARASGSSPLLESTENPDEPTK